MKTALTELIEKWESELGSYIPNAPIYRAFIEEAKTFLEKEKQDLLEAFSDGVQIGADHGEDGEDSVYEDFNKWFNRKIS